MAALRFSFLALMMLSPASVHAQVSDCSGAATQLDANFCAKAGWESADGDLNGLWRVLKPLADKAGWGGRLLTEQRAWLGRRDGTCDAERSQYAGGSIAPLVYWQCMERLTRQRNAEFRSMIR
ncbi:MAG: lysozyme inhibitor LprI family protein [Pseudomonadota bacterium]